MKAFALAALMMFAAAPAVAAPVTIRGGESWVFAVERGEPARARRVPASTRPGAGEIKATLIVGMGTTMTLTNNSPTGYTFRAELIGAPGAKGSPPRTCTLPPGRQPVLEYWPVKAAAVRLSAFKVAAADGNCP